MSDELSKKLKKAGIRRMDNIGKAASTKTGIATGPFRDANVVFVNGEQAGEFEETEEDGEMQYVVDEVAYAHPLNAIGHILANAEF